MTAQDLTTVPRTVLYLAEKKEIDPEEALSLMRGTSINLICGESVKNSVHLQIALLTAVNISKRTFLGGVSVSMPEETPNLTPFEGRSLNEMLKQYLHLPQNGGKNYTICVGNNPVDKSSCEVICNDWQGGINVYNSERVSLDRTEGTLPFGPVAGASIACFYLFSIAFDIIDPDNFDSTGVSLWDCVTDNWYDSQYKGPAQLFQLPAKLWFVGLGHLGQAYIWLLGCMPFENRRLIEVVLQDFDEVSESNLGSQLLSEDRDVGRKKTRVCAEFLESLGFSTRIIEKPFEASDQSQLWTKQLNILVNGVDSVTARRNLIPERFDLLLDGATNGSEAFFDSFTLRNLKQLDKDPKDIWQEEDFAEDVILHKKLYERVEKRYGCGAYINHSISTPFVGAMGATFVMGELFRKLNDGKQHSIVSLELRNLKYMRAFN